VDPLHWKIPEDKNHHLLEVRDVSIVRIGLAETKHFSEGYEAIFGGGKKKDKPTPKAKKAGKKPKAAKKKTKK